MVRPADNDSTQNKCNFVSPELIKNLREKLNQNKLQEVQEIMTTAIKEGRVRKAKPGTKPKISPEEIAKGIERLKNEPVTYQQKVDKEQTTIQNLIEDGKKPLNRPKDKPIQTTTGPNGGKFEVFPQRANGTYVTIETLDNGETFECTYSETGEKLNETRRNSLSTTITTYNGNTTDKITISKMNGVDIVGKIQAGNILPEIPPTLEEVTGMPLMGWRTK